MKENWEQKFFREYPNAAPLICIMVGFPIGLLIVIFILKLIRGF